MDLLSAFGAFDANGDGQITRQEFRNILTRNNSSLTVTDADSIFDSLDTSKDGVLSLTEFARGLGGGGTHSAKLTRAAAGGIATRAAAKVKRNDGRNWVPDGMPIDELDDVHGVKLQALKQGLLEAVKDTSGPKQAGETVKAQLDSFGTAVLATVEAGAWRLNWVAGLLYILLSCVPRCCDLNLLAIKGGDACDCEIKFIEALMEELGAKVDTFRKVSYDGERIRWTWFLKRKGAEDCTVYLNQYQKVEYATVGFLQKDFLPNKDYMNAPNLNRVAVVSAPVVDKEGKPIAQELNENVSKALEGAKAIADKKGFAPDHRDFDAWYKAFTEYNQE